jgi:hypothetical protein
LPICDGNSGTREFQEYGSNDLVAPGLWIRFYIGSGFNDFLDPDPGGKKKKKVFFKSI